MGSSAVSNHNDNCGGGNSERGFNRPCDSVDDAFVRLDRQRCFVNLTRTRFGINGGRICQLLVAVGLPKREVYRGERTLGAFWQREEPRLLEWLDRAHKAYRKRMRSLHPDLSGDNESATRLNVAWERIEHLFRKHGVEL